MTLADLAFLAMGAVIGIVIALLVWWVDDWAARKHHQALTEARIVTWQDDDLTTDLPSWEPDEATKAQIRAFIPVARAAEEAATVAQVEAYLHDTPYDWRREGL